MRIVWSYSCNHVHASYAKQEVTYCETRCYEMLKKREINCRWTWGNVNSRGEDERFQFCYVLVPDARNADLWQGFTTYSRQAAHMSSRPWSFLTSVSRLLTNQRASQQIVLIEGQAGFLLKTASNVLLQQYLRNLMLMFCFLFNVVTTAK